VSYANSPAPRALVLASTSPYRRELLGRLGLPFTVRAPTTEETALPGESPERMAERLAAAKAASIGAHDAIVIGSDQTASLEGRLLRKPGRHEIALAQLEAAQGKTVVFHTGVHVLDTAAGTSWSHVDRTEVSFTRRGRDELQRYLEIEQPFDCVGSFKAEGLGVALFESIESSDPTALIGLPLIWLAAALKSAGLDPLSPAYPRPAP
jgi:septum formation protein